MDRWKWSFLALVALGVGLTIATYLARLPTDARGYYNRGVADVHDGKIESGIANLDRALELDPKRSDALVARGAAWMRAGRPYRALTDAVTALTITPDSSRALVVRGEALAAIGREDEALASFDRAVGLDPHLARAALDRADLLFDRGSYTEAAEAYRAAGRLRREDASVHRAPLMTWAAVRMAGKLGAADDELRTSLRDSVADRLRLSAWVDAALSAGPATGAVPSWLRGVSLLSAGDRAGAVAALRGVAAEAASPSWERARARAMISNVVLGLRVEPPNKEISETLSFGPGLAVACVRGGGPADAAGIRAGDRLVRVGGEEASVEAVDRLDAEAALGREVPLELLRGSEPMEVAIRVGG